MINLLFAIAVTSASVHVPKPAAALAAPVLNAMVDVRSGENQRNLRALDDAVEAVCNKRTPASDEALAVLLQFYVGEHSSEDISCELVHRGRRVLPFLEKYHGRQIVVPGVDMSRTEPLDTLYEEVRHRIRAGEKCEREP